MPVIRVSIFPWFNLHARRIILQKVLSMDNRGQGRRLNLSLLFYIHADIRKTLSTPVLVFFLDVVLSGISKSFRSYITVTYYVP
jgi:hypothetical protein